MAADKKADEEAFRKWVVAWMKEKEWDKEKQLERGRSNDEKNMRERVSGERT